MNFGDALHLLRNGEKVARNGWNGKNMFLFVVLDWDISKVVSHGAAQAIINTTEILPFICMKTADDKLVPWLASQTDILANDWVVVA